MFHSPSAFRLSICLLLLSTLFSFPAAAITPARPFRVGLITSLSGEAAAFGESERAAVEMAMEKLPPGLKDSFQVYIEDDSLDPKQTIAAYRKLRSKHDVDLIINFSSGTSNALAPLTEQEKIPLIAIASDPRIVQDRRYAVNLWVTPEEEAKTTLLFAKARGYRTIARITTLQDGYLSLKNSFDRFNDGTIKIAVDDEYPQDEKNFKPFLSKVCSRKDVDAILILCMPGHVGVVAKQARGLGCSQPMLGIESFEDPSEVKVSCGALVGQHYIIADSADGAFLKEFTGRFPGVSTFVAGNTYDAMLLTAAAAQKNTSRDAVNNYLHTVKDFPGVMGTYSASGDNRFTLKAAVKVVKPDGFEKVEHW